MGTLALFTLYMTAFLSIGQASIIGLAVISGILIYRIKQGWG
jgi:hypothetical protein